MDDNTIKRLQQIEQNELNLLIGRGLSFTVSVAHWERRPGLRGWFSPRVKIRENKTFEIHEATLSTLDRLTELSLQMALDEGRLQNDEQGHSINQAWQITAGNPRRMARMVAIAVLGEDYYVTRTDPFGRTRRSTDEQELDRLTDLFFCCIAPSKLFTLCQMVTAMSNLGDFLNSMRLMSGARTTAVKTHRVE